MAVKATGVAFGLATWLAIGPLVAAF